VAFREIEDGEFGETSSLADQQNAEWQANASKSGSVKIRPAIAGMPSRIVSLFDRRFQQRLVDHVLIRYRSVHMQGRSDAAHWLRQVRRLAKMSLENCKVSHSHMRLGFLRHKVRFVARDIGAAPLAFEESARLKIAAALKRSVELC
jgi:hypothetical protein